jgi:signal peptidase I
MSQTPEYTPTESSASDLLNKLKSVATAIGLFFIEFIKIAILAGIAIWFIRSFLFKPFYVRGQSMFPTFQERDYLIIDELSFRLREPARGEVVVFHAPTPQGEASEKEFYLKRIIGLPGERIKIENGHVIVYNKDHLGGVVLNEYYLRETTGGSQDVTLGDDEYFVLGDNRDASYDSRGFGPIKQDTIVGRTWFRGLPLERVSRFYIPDYQL